MIEKRRLAKYAHAIKSFTKQVAKKHKMLERIEKFQKDYEEFK